MRNIQIKFEKWRTVKKQNNHKKTQILMVVSSLSNCIFYPKNISTKYHSIILVVHGIYMRSATNSGSPFWLIIKFARLPVPKSLLNLLPRPPKGVLL